MNVKKTIINLNRVLGTNDQIYKVPYELTQQKVQQPIKAVVDLPNKVIINYPLFAETVNGRCAMSGVLISKCVYDFTGESVLQQIDLNRSEIELFILFIYCMSFITHRLYQPERNIELFEKLVGRVIMFNIIFLIF